jgi:hypothetical protein
MYFDAKVVVAKGGKGGEERVVGVVSVSMRVANTARPSRLRETRPVEVKRGGATRMRKRERRGRTGRCASFLVLLETGNEPQTGSKREESSEKERKRRRGGGTEQLSSLLLCGSEKGRRGYGSYSTDLATSQLI